MIRGDANTVLVVEMRTHKHTERERERERERRLQYTAPQLRYSAQCKQICMTCVDPAVPGPTALKSHQFSAFDDIVQKYSEFRSNVQCIAFKVILMHA